MSAPFSTTPNRFKHRLQAGEELLGLWAVLGDGYVAELLAGCCYDWILVDGEHGPNDLRTTLAQLQGIAAAAPDLGELAAEVSQPVVRIPHHSPALIKQILEIGARNLMVPMVESADEARELVRAVRYPPEGIRGMGSGLARSAKWGRSTDYLLHANENMCLILQAESRVGVEAAAEIAAVDGVDAIFFGAVDLAADMGLSGQLNHPDVDRVVQEAAERVRAAGKPTGLLTFDPDSARTWLDRGMTFVGVGADASLLVQAADGLLHQLRPSRPASPASY